MKENIEKKIETFVYGILSLVFGAAFFFGVLYPSHGLSPNACRVKEPIRQEMEIPEQSMQGSIRFPLRDPLAKGDREEIRVTFLLYERLKNS